MHDLDIVLADILQHEGVKGMKWGVRRDRNRPGGADGKGGKKEASKKSAPKKVVKVKSGQLKKHPVIKQHRKTTIKDAAVLAGKAYLVTQAAKAIIGVGVSIYVGSQMPAV